MQVANAAQLFAWNALWRATGLRTAGRALIRALGAQDDDVRTIAGMFLVRSGRRAEPLLDEALKDRENLPMVLAILADLGETRYEPVLRVLTRDPDPIVADAAQQALKVLEFHRQG